jgi:pyruvate dehydrogenase E2 component (dihydrolipoamide acetyltransferase)
MATKVVMEALSPTMEEGRLVAWTKQEGDAVKAGETLAEVETDKAVMELVARVDGVLRQRVVAEGATVPVGAVVAIIGAADEVIERTGAPAHRRTDVDATSAAAPAGRIFASPLARRLATERGVDLRGIAGSGPGGRVVKRDVEAAPAATQAAPAAEPAPPGGYRDVPLTQIRKTIAKRLAQSLGPIPHFYLTSEIEMERAAEMREQLKAHGDAYAVSFNDIIVKAVALALRQHPAVNAAFLDDRIRYFGDIHVGIAVAVDDGLITPVIRHADRKGLAEIAAESRALAERARARKLQPDEYTGATCSVSNLGMYDIDEFTAVINPPEAAILAVGRVVAKPVAVGGAVLVRRMMRVTLSCDHRVVDGATGARFLQSLKLMLENPLAMLL